MAINTKAVKARINSVKNTRKISKAMQMIAAVKMRKAVQSTINSRTYSNLSNEILELINQKKLEHKLAEHREPVKNLLILITSNKGLCGNYNSAVTKEAQKFVKDCKIKNREVDVLALGNKAAGFAKRNNLKLVGVYEDLNEKSIIKDIYPISRVAINSFIDKEYDRVCIAFTNYISGLIQHVEVKQLLPISKESVIELSDLSDEVFLDIQKNNEVITSELETETVEDFDTLDLSDVDEIVDNEEEYLFEPGREELLNYLIPMLVEVQIFQSILESSASEHSSRMIAMKSATDSAGDMINNLTLEFNKGRQAAITQEVAEINAGADAIN